MITLRPNQIEPINIAIRFFRDGGEPSLIVLPTAWGKSILTAYVAKHCGGHLIVLQPSKELLEQNYNKYKMLCGGEGVDCGVFSASMSRKEIAPITYATIGSIKALGAKFKALGFDKILIDEAHLYPRSSDSMLGRFLRESGIRNVLGITATPLKLQSGRDQFGQFYSKLVMLTSRSKDGNFFKSILYVGQIEEMVRLGYWSKLVYERQAFDERLLVFNTSKSEYTEASVRKAFKANNLYQSVLNALNNHQERSHILVYVPSVKEAIELASHCQSAGVVYGTQDKQERERVIADFRAGILRVLFNVRVLSTGFDYNGIDCIILAFSTASIALYYQIIGRGTRIAQGKQNCLICDLGGNTNRFGRVEDIRFERGVIWRMFGTGGKLLSGIPISDIGKYNEADIKLLDSRRTAQLTVMPFGMWKGHQIKDIPETYRRWMIRAFKWNDQNTELRNAIILSMRK